MQLIKIPDASGILATVVAKLKKLRFEFRNKLKAIFYLHYNLEKELGKSVISRGNALNYKYIDDKKSKKKK